MPEYVGAYERSGDDLQNTTNISLGQGSDASIDMKDAYGETVFKSGSMPLADALRYEHPDYYVNRRKWDKYFAMYEGSDVWQYIHRHLRESDAMFEKRVQRGYYYNYTASVVDLYIAYIFHSPISRQINEKQFEELYKNADLRGTKFALFIQLASTFAQIAGHCGILVDMPKAPDLEFLSEEDRKAANHRPYLTLINPLQILDWEDDNFGNFVWVKIEIQKMQERQWNDSVDNETRYFLIWTRTNWEEWQLIGDEAKRIDGGVHDLEEIPLIILRNERKPRHKWFGISAIRDIADINIAILNWSSLGDEEIFERCLNVLTMERDDSEAAGELSHHNILEFTPGATPPAYLTPGDSPLTLIGQWIERAKDEIYRLAKFGGSVGLMGARQATSGIAYAFEFNETNQALAKKAENIQHAEIEIHRLYCKWLNEEFEGTIIYPDEFGVEDFLMEFQILAEARSTLTSETAIKEIEKKIVARMFATDPGKLRDKMVKEIEEADPKEAVKPPMLPPDMKKIPGDEQNQGSKSPKTGNPGEGKPEPKGPEA